MTSVTPRSVPNSFACLLSLSLGLAGCADKLDPGSRVVSFRVLAEQMDAPYAAPGETVHVSSLTHDPENRSITWAWATCVNPSASSVEGCLDGVTLDDSGMPQLLAFGEDRNSVEVTVPTNTLEVLPADVRHSASVGVLSAACPGSLTFESGPAGLPFRCTDGKGVELNLDEFIVGVKRIGVRASDRNANPVIGKVTFDGADWPADFVPEVDGCDDKDDDLELCPDKTRHRLSAEVTKESIESGTDEFGRSFDEQVIVQYYSTEGIFKDEIRTGQSPKNEWAASKRPGARDATLWFVARDDRGGVTWTQRRVQVR